MTTEIAQLTPLRALRDGDGSRASSERGYAETTHRLHDLGSFFTAHPAAAGGGKRIRICVVDPTLDLGSAEWLAAQLALGANRSIFEFVFVTWRSYDSPLAAYLTANGVRVICASTWKRRELTLAEWQAAALGELLERLRPDIVFFPSPCLLEQLPAEQLAEFGVVVCSSDEQLEAVARDNPGSTMLIGGAVDTSVFRPVPPAEKEELKRRHGLDGKTVVLLAAGVGAPYLRTVLVQDVIRTIKAARPDAAFLVVGSVNPQDAGEEAFHDFVASEGVIWEQTAWPWEMPRLLQVADVFLPASEQHEGLQQPVLEALACGVIPVVAKRSGVEELLEHGDNGFLVESDDPAAIARQICAVIALGSEARLRLSESVRRTVEGQFDLAERLAACQRLLLNVYRRRPARVCITDGSFGIGGAEWLVAQLILNSDPREIGFELVAYRGGSPLTHWLEQQRVVVHEAPRNMSYSEWRRHGLEHIFRELRPDVVMPCTINTWPGHDPFHRLLIIAQNASDGAVLADWQYDQADHVLCVSDDVRQALSADHQWKMTVLRNSIDVELFAPDPVSRARVRETLRIAPDAHVVVWCGRMHEPQKRLDVLMEVIRELEGDASVHFLVLGYFHEDEGDQDEWQRLVRSSRKVSWVTGLSPWETPEYYAAADIYLSTSGFARSDFEGLSLAAVQALATELPVVTTMSGGQQEVVEDGLNGRLVETGDVRGLVDAIRELVAAKRSDLKKIGRRNRRKALESFDIRRHAEVYTRLSRLLKNTVGSALAVDPDLAGSPHAFEDEAGVGEVDLRRARSFLSYTWALLPDRSPPPFRAGDHSVRELSFLDTLVDGDGPVLVAGSTEDVPGLRATVTAEIVSTLELGDRSIREPVVPEPAATPAGTRGANGAASSGPRYPAMVVAPPDREHLRLHLRQAEALASAGGWLVIPNVGPDYSAEGTDAARYSARTICGLLDYLEERFPLWSQCERRGPHLLLQRSSTAVEAETTTTFIQSAAR